MGALIYHFLVKISLHRVSHIIQLILVFSLFHNARHIRTCKTRSDQQLLCFLFAINTCITQKASGITMLSQVSAKPSGPEKTTLPY
jgi:hypothetical protein